MHSRWISTGSVFCMIAVATGAFGAHALKDVLSEYQLDVWNKAVLYQFIHALAICITGILALNVSAPVLGKAAWLFMAGIICFSGSLYILATKDMHGINVKWLGPVTPLGGLCFIAGWALLAIGKLKVKGEN
jgi:uncharacterized membrane protein YgdD (TMEM256/DUF423 family)